MFDNATHVPVNPAVSPDSPAAARRPLCVLAAAALGAAVLLGGCASYGYGGNGGYYGSSAYEYGYDGYGYGSYLGYGSPYESYYGSPYGYGGYYGGYGGYPPYYHRPRPPQGTPQPPAQGTIGNPPPWRDPVRRQQRLSGQLQPSAGDRGAVGAPVDQSPRDVLRIRRERTGQEAVPQSRMERMVPRMERATPRMERAVPRMERSAPRFERPAGVGRASERDAGPELTP